MRQNLALHRNTISRFQSTHSLRSATVYCNRKFWLYVVSIHALLAECDPLDRASGRHQPVSIHALLAECDWELPCGVQKSPCFNPRTPCGVRPLRRPMRLRVGCFNPRTPCGVRPAALPLCLYPPGFQSTHSLRSATFFLEVCCCTSKVSIHALLAECDD